MGRNSFYILSCGFTFSTLNFKFSSTLVEESLQISSFMQNKANFQKSQMNVNKVLTKDYEKRTLGQRGKKQSQTNPNKPKTNPIKPKKLIPTCRDLVLKSQNLSKRRGNWLIWLIVYWAAAPGSCDDSKCRRAGRIIWIVANPSLFGAIKSFIWLSAT